jgi:hypothetical protein
MTRKEMLPYLAGFFDGEGTVAIYRQNTQQSENSYFLYVSISQKKSRASLLVAKYLLATFGGSLYEWTTKSKSIMWSWQLSRDNAVPFLQQMKPYTFIKFEQIVVALNWQRKKIRLKSGPLSESDPKTVAYLRETKRVTKLLRDLKK